MKESILISIKKLLGIYEDDTNFDTDIIIHINSAFMILGQLGVSTSPFSITGNSEVWSDFVGDRTNLESIKSYIYLKVKLLFDPPLSSAVLESYNKLINELEWRIFVTVDPTSSQNGGEE